MDSAEKSTAALAPVIREVTVDLDRERAFRLFTARVGEWWPLASHAVEGTDAVTCAFEQRVGGRFYEVGPDGREHTWGTLLEWDPPARLALTWHAGRDDSRAQHLEVTFEPAAGGTRVRLVHTGWERLGDEAVSERDAYETGWVYVLGFYVSAAAR